MSYYHAKRSLIAKQYLSERDAEQRASVQRDNRFETSRAWLDDYLTHKRRTIFDWRPRFAISPPEETHDEEGEDEKAKLANATTTSEEVGIPEACSDAASPSKRNAQG